MFVAVDTVEEVGFHLNHDRLYEILINGGELPPFNKAPFSYNLKGSEELGQVVVITDYSVEEGLIPLSVYVEHPNVDVQIKIVVRERGLENIIQMPENGHLAVNYFVPKCTANRIVQLTIWVDEIECSVGVLNN